MDIAWDENKKHIKMFDLILADVDSVLEFEDVEVLVGGQAALVAVVELLAARLNLVDQSLKNHSYSF